LEEKNKQQSDRVSELEEQNRRQADKIENLEEQIEDLEFELSLSLAVYAGDSYPIETAYENGWLTRDDIMHISYFQYGVVIGGTRDDLGSDYEIEFVPTKKTPELSERAKKAIKTAEANRVRNNGAYSDATPDNVYIDDYLGVYNGYAVMRMEYNDGSFGYPANMIRIEFDGIILIYSGPQYRVYKLE
ncbi:MAG: hypothetical protein J1F36_04470, partial [Clostridiales bacterium]|nr:hypothetical protein [Clostridiales bacterium]